MADFDNTNRFTIGKNKRKEAENHADLKGSLNVDGVEFWLSAWKKTAGDGSTFYSGTIQRKEAQAAVSNGGGKPASYKDALDGDDIPFSAEFR